MPLDPICNLTATDLRSEIAAGNLSAREVVQAHLDRIDQCNPQVNAIVTLDAEGALRQAALADEAYVQKKRSGESLGVLHGLPVAHKDTFLTAGMKTTWGSPIYRDFVPQQDSLIVTRQREAGAITLGKTNMPEFGAGSHTFNPVFGATRNPYDLGKSAGGSSGGSAAALACRMVALADGSDMGGSLRNPASFCNVVGLRPSPGRVPQWPGSAPWHVLGVAGPMGRSVADVSLYLAALAGEPLVMREPGSGVRHLVEAAFRQAGLSASASLELAGVEGIKQAVRAGLGVGFVSALSMRHEDGALAALQIGREGLRRTLSILVPHAQTSARATRQFLADCLSGEV